MLLYGDGIMLDSDSWRSQLMGLQLNAPLVIPDWKLCVYNNRVNNKYVEGKVG